MPVTGSKFSAFNNIPETCNVSIIDPVEKAKLKFSKTFFSLLSTIASAKSIVLFILVMIVALIQLRCTRKKEVQL